MPQEQYKALLKEINNDDAENWRYETNKISYNDSIYKSYEDVNYNGKKESELITGLSEEIIHKLQKVLTDEELFILLKREIYFDINMTRRKKVHIMSFREIGEMLSKPKPKQRVNEIYERAINKLLKNFTEDDFISVPDSYYPPKRASMGWLSDFYTNHTPCQLMEYVNNGFSDNNSYCPGAYDRQKQHQLICGKICCNKNIPAGLNVSDCMKLFDKSRSTIEKYFDNGRLPGHKIPNGKTKRTWVTTGEPITQCNHQVYSLNKADFNPQKHEIYELWLCYTEWLNKGHSNKYYFDKWQNKIKEILIDNTVLRLLLNLGYRYSYDKEWYKNCNIPVNQMLNIA